MNALNNLKLELIKSIKKRRIKLSLSVLRALFYTVNVYSLGF